MLQAMVDEPFMAVLGRVRQVAVAQGWLLTSGGSPQAPTVPMVFRHGFGSFSPATGMQVELTTLDEGRTQVEVTVWRGTAVVDGYEANRLLHALGVPAG